MLTKKPCVDIYVIRPLSLDVQHVVMDEPPEPQAIHDLIQDRVLARVPHFTLLARADKPAVHGQAFCAGGKGTLIMPTNALASFLWRRSLSAEGIISSPNGPELRGTVAFVAKDQDGLRWLR